MTVEGLLEERPLPSVPVSGRGIATAASVIALGNVSSRILGLVRETVIADLFGATGLVSAFRVASIVPTMIYDLLVGGMISSALVPVFSDYATPDRKQELWRVASIMLSLAVVILSALATLLAVFAPQVAWLLGGGFEPELQAQTTTLIRLIAPAVVFLSLSGITTGLLYSLRRFTYPAFTATVFNASVVVMAFLLSSRLGIASLVVGVVVGAVLQVALQLPGLRGLRFTFSLDLAHPALRRIVRLYLPIILGLIVSQIGIAIDRNLASRTGEQSIAWMQYATTLIQFPLGLVVVAVSLAILPTLSQQASTLETHAGPADPPSEAFRSTLALGLKMVLLLIIPATVGLFVLARPIVTLLFEHGDFLAFDTAQTALALRYYLIGLSFAAIDQPLVFAFYARKDTMTPALVGVVGVSIYLVAALLLMRPLGFIGLVLANSAQLTGHALIMLWLLRHRLGGLEGYGLPGLSGRALLASLGMGLLLYGTLEVLGGLLHGGGLWGEVILVGGAGGVGLVTYAAFIWLLGVPEARMMWDLGWGRIKGRGG